MRNIMPSLHCGASACSPWRAASAQAQDVKYNYASGTDFAKFKTYRWIDLPAAEKPDPLVDQQIREAIDANLAKKGLTKATGETADLLVAYQLAVTRNNSGMPTAPVVTATAATAGGTAAWAAARRPRPAAR